MKKIYLENEKYLNPTLGSLLFLFTLSHILDFILIKDLMTIIYIVIDFLSVLFIVIKYPVKDISEKIFGHFVAISTTLHIFLFDYTIVQKGFLFNIGSIIFVTGCSLCLFAILSLNRSFSILPTYRGFIQTKYIYQYIRHPIYASYIIINSGFILCYPSIRNVVILIVGVILFVLRIEYEEELLNKYDSYREYKKSTKYKLLPNIY